MTFALGGLLYTLALLLEAIEGSGAIPPAEFAPAALVFRAAPLLAGAGLLALVIHLIQLLRGTPTRLDLLAFVGAGLVASSAFYLPLLLVGLGLGALSMVADGELAAMTLPSLSSPRALLRALVTTLAALVPAGVLLIALEFVLRTRGFFAAGLINESLVMPYLGAAAGFGASAILKCAVSVGRVLLFAGIGIAALSRAPRQAAAASATWLVALVIALEHLRILRMSLRDEIDQLDLNIHAAALTLAGALLLLPLVRRILEETRSLADLPRTLAAIPGGSAPRRGILVNALVLLGFFPLLYPQVEDYRERFFDCAALFALVFLTSLMVRLGIARLERLRFLALALLIAGMVAFGTLGQRPDLRLVAFEYSRFGAFGAGAPWSRYFEKADQLGMKSETDARTWPDFDRPAPSPSPKGKRPGILFFLWDAARPDRMSLHGYGRDTTPNLVKLAPRAQVFDEVRSSATATTLGVRNILSGAYNSRYMLSENHLPFLVGPLHRVGYDDFFVTVTGNDFNGISAQAFLRGWDSARALPEFHFHEYPNRDHIKPDADKVHDVLDHIDARLAERGNLDGSFAYVHLTGTHTPWRNDDPVRDFGKSPLDRYDGEMAKLDALLGQVIEHLAAAGCLDDVVIVVTADHGTGLGEHGRLAGFLPYEEQLRVPLVLMLPGVAGRRIAAPVTSLDIAPTLLDLVGMSAPGIEGRSLLPLIAGGARPERAFVAFCAFQDSFAIFDPDFRFKLHHHRGRNYEALFDLENDPGEKMNILRAQPEMAAKLRAQLDHFLAQGKARYGNPYHYRAWDPEAR